MTITQFGGCDLHLPHKKWSGNPMEEQNYEAIEQWARRVQGCIPAQPASSTGLTFKPHRTWYVEDLFVLNNGSTGSMTFAEQRESINGEIFQAGTSWNGMQSLLLAVPGMYMWSGFANIQTDVYNTLPDPQAQVTVYFSDPEFNQVTLLGNIDNVDLPVGTGTYTEIAFGGSMFYAGVTREVYLSSAPSMLAVQVMVKGSPFATATTVDVTVNFGVACMEIVS
jgi:hypothetical protein